MNLIALLLLLPVAILAELYMQCPNECRCTDMVTKHAPHNWRMMMSERRLHRLIFGPGKHYFSRRISESKTSSGRQMTCLGLLSMPAYIPPDIKKLCIYGDMESAKRQTIQPNEVLGYQRDSPYRVANRLRSSPRQLTTIDKTKFSSATKIKQLALEGNRIKEIHPMQFESLHELTTLSLKHNHLKTLAHDAFKSLVNLRELDLTDNQIKRVSSAVFQYTPEMRQLKLKSNKLTKLPSDAFKNLDQLEVLDLSENKLTFLPEGVFDNLHALKELHLGQNALGEIKATVFHYLSGLTKLSLKGNQLSILPTLIFRPFIYLKDLDLSENKLRKISSSAFQSQLNLINLDISNNRIKNIEDGSFENTTSLVTLRLSHNGLRFLRNKMWLGLKYIQKLYLDNNEIQEIDNEAIKVVTSIQAIDLSHNQITRIPTRTFAGFLQLREIKLNNNAIKQVDDEAFGVSILNSQSKVTWIYLQYNKMRNIKARAFYGLPWLKFLNICYNKVRNIHQKAFSYARNINSLILNNNELVNLEVGTFRHQNRLKMLNLAHNNLVQLSFNVFLGLEMAEDLNLEFNQIREMSYESFLDTPNLRRIDLKGNRLRTIDMRTFESMIKLRHLEFAKNEISRVVQPTFYQGLLKYLSFSGNKLYTLDGNITNTLSFGGILNLHGNPWLCECHLTWLPKLAMQGYIGIPNDDDITCKQPERLMGRQVTKLHTSDLQCLSAQKYNRLTTMMEASYMKHVCNVATNQVANLTASRPRLPRKELAHWHATMVRNQNGEAMCNGVILDSDWVLTTATCWQRNTSPTYDANNNNNISIVLGEVFPKQLPWKLRTPGMVVIHPNYTRADGLNDLALVKLKPLEAGITSLLTRFPCILDSPLLESVMRHRRRGRVSSRLTTKKRIKIRSKSVKVRQALVGDVIHTTVNKLTDSYNAEGAPFYFDLGDAGWVLAGVKNAFRKPGSKAHQFIPLGPQVSWINAVLSGKITRG